MLIKILRKPLFHSTNKVKVLHSRWIWNEDYSGDEPIFHLTLLGIINSLLPKNVFLVVYVPHAISPRELVGLKS